MRILANGLHLGYEEWGSGQPLVLLHAFLCNRSMWTHQISALTHTHQYRVILPDFRGFGESDAPGGPYPMEVLAEDTAALLDTLHIERCILGGLSMGGYVAFAFYRLYPERVRALILADTRSHADTPEARATREELAQRAEHGDRGAVISHYLPKMLTPQTLSDPTGTTARLRAMLDAAPPKGIVGALRGMAQRRDSTDLLPQIRCPTLLVFGEQDALTPPAEAQFMAGRIPNAQVVTIPQAAHLANLEQPEAFNQALVAFLEKAAVTL
jgi:3-oxoadipate enol-lactonase